MIRMMVNMLKNESGTNSKHTDRRWTHDKGVYEDSAQNSEPWLKNDKFISNIDLEQSVKNWTLRTILSMVTSFEYARINWNEGTRPPVHHWLIILPKKGKPSHSKVKKIICLSVLTLKVLCTMHLLVEQMANQ